MTRRSKLLITAAVLAGLAGAAVPTLAAQTGASNGAAVQTAFGGPDDGRGFDGGPWHHEHGFGPGGPGPMGMGFGPPGRGLEALLEKFDTNKDGKITKAQIDAVLADQMKKYDTDGDGTLSLSEYQALFDDQMHEAMVRSFQALDREGAGKVTLDELRAPIDRVVQRLDRNHTGVIDLNQLDGPRQGPGDRNAPPPADQQNGG
jgi:Ca2+-binding EF-hand superfamily protein